MRNVCLVCEALAFSSSGLVPLFRSLFSSLELSSLDSNLDGGTLKTAAELKTAGLASRLNILCDAYVYSEIVMIYETINLYYIGITSNKNGALEERVVTTLRNIVPPFAIQLASANIQYTKLRGPRHA
jgi:hypothetical protein